VTVRRILIR